jgi:hypothetical protein
MSEAELQRMREDLDTIQQAAGLALPFRWADVWQTLAMAPAGVLLAVWAYFGPADYLGIGLLPLLLLALVAGVRHLWKPRVSELDPGVRREKLFDTVSNLAVGAGLAGYFLWAKKFGLALGVVGAVACYFLGITCFLLGLTAPARRVYFAGAVSLIPFGLMIPLCGNQQMVAAVGGLAVLLAGLTAPAILAWQLRTSPRGS